MATTFVPSVSAMATAAAAPASVVLFPAPKANNSRKVVVPGMIGYELLKRFKESAALRDILVVIMSSENVPTRITRCLEEFDLRLTVIYALFVVTK
jgi:hypothetical protein